MRVLMCGDRKWRDAAAIKRELDKLAPSVIISGGARGADALAAEYARAAGIELIEHPAEWKRYGRVAGPIRNGRCSVIGPISSLRFTPISTRAAAPAIW
jgi:hypothetical protein